MTLTLDLPEELAERLTATYPDQTERHRFMVGSLLDAIEAEQQERAEIIEILNADIAAVEAGNKGYTQEEMEQHWAELEAEMRRKLTP